MHCEIKHKNVRIQVGKVILLPMCLCRMAGVKEKDTLVGEITFPISVLIFLSFIS